MSTASHGEYYIPEPSKWPVIGTVALTTSVIGAVNTIHAGEMSLLLPVGLLMIAYLFFGWFGAVIDESLAGNYNTQVDKSFRLGMMWFIFSEVMFFAAFFGALFYARVLAVPWLGGAGNNASTHEFLWPAFEAVWPLLSNPSSDIVAPREAMGAMGLPAINTAILLTSSVTVTWAHHALRAGNRKHLNIGLGLTVLLGVCFLILQVEEYIHAYNELGLTMDSGIYGSTFFLLTGFHGFHVTMGTTMLFVILIRCLKGHFTADNHFGFEAVAWYWHFVDVVWLGLFIFVYWL
ncbi:MAG: cytochrome c oxidase subunit 3 [endosymbiont of Galathealinum brachiosum]|uniref:cytochrome-c oxidase n=1 Tax=endosymbiont of Galathealinum brachiosum TaxID=2200906 RepID=A0A370DFW7_9GAMM|nr:MAG: cytochrome c oxidase subunit 3 [endosymbiont of Galathealinum brachiosum]